MTSTSSLYPPPLPPHYRRAVEKCFTFARADVGVDSDFSLEPAEMAILAEEAERAWQALEQVRYRPTEAERKSWCSVVLSMPPLTSPKEKYSPKPTSASCSRDAAHHLTLQFTDGALSAECNPGDLLPLD